MQREAISIAPRIGRPARARRRDRLQPLLLACRECQRTDRDRFRINLGRGNAEGIKIAVDQAGIELLGAKIRVVDQRLEETRVGFRPATMVFASARPRRFSAVSRSGPWAMIFAIIGS